MGMDVSLHVEAIKPPDAKWEKMKSVWDSCKAAGIDPPDEVGKFFHWQGPVSEGVKLKIGEIDVMRSFGKTRGKQHEAIVRVVSGDESGPEANQGGFVIDVSKLPADAKWLKVYAYVSC